MHTLWQHRDVIDNKLRVGTAMDRSTCGSRSSSASCFHEALHQMAIYARFGGTLGTFIDGPSLARTPQGFLDAMGPMEADGGGRDSTRWRRHRKSSRTPLTMNAENRHKPP
jgi:hypothetical protein